MSNTDRIVLKSTDTERFILVKSDEDTVRKVTEALQAHRDRIFPEEVLAIFPYIAEVDCLGASIEMTEGIAKQYMEVLEYKPPTTRVGLTVIHRDESTEWKCYARNDKKCIFNNVNVHEQVNESFYCALDRIGRPHWIIILKQKIEKCEIEEKMNQLRTEINGESIPDSDNNTEVHTEGEVVGQTDGEVLPMEQSKELHNREGNTNAEEIL